MMMTCSTVAACVALATTITAQTYGYSEMSCIFGKRIIPCAKGAMTASGEVFDPEKATIAVWMPRKMKVTPTWVFMRTEHGECTWLRVNDKKGARGFDVTPGALKKLGEIPSRKWSGKLYLCDSTYQNDEPV